jgi:DNA processing protein
MAFNFLRRNRIIAGMSSATILVESKAQGGGMMTARLAFSYERDVYALPGRVDDIRSQGCNQLIMEKIAEPITDLDELVDKLGLKAARKGKASDILKDVEAKYKGHIPDGNLDDLLDILQLIKNNRGITLDELCNKSEKPYSTIAECTGMLESDGVISIDLIQRCTINLKIV